MKGGCLSSLCDILHTELPHYYTWNRRAWTLPRVGMSDVRVSCGGDQGTLGFIILPTQVLPPSGGGGAAFHKAWIHCNAPKEWGSLVRAVQKPLLLWQQVLYHFLCVSVIKNYIYIYIYMWITFIRLWYLQKALLSFLPQNQQFNFRLGQYQNDDHYYSRCFFGGLCEFTDCPSSIDSDRCLHY